MTHASARGDFGGRGGLRGVVVDGLFEVFDAIADGFAEHRQFSRSKDHQHDNHNNDQMPRLQDAYTHFGSPGRTIQP